MKIFEQKKHINLLLIIALFIYSVMLIIFIQPEKNFSNYISVMASMNYDNMRLFLTDIHTKGNLKLFSLLFILDILFFSFLGLYFLFLLRFQAKYFKDKWRNIILLISLIGPLSIIFDGIETLTLHYMILNYAHFPKYLVYIQTPFSFIALATDFLAIVWIIINRFHLKKLKINI